MTNQKFNLTLTRWHKVADRLQQEITRQSTEVDSAYMRTRFDANTKESANRSGLMESIVSTVENAIKLNDALLSSICTIRTELAKANAKLGVAERLALIDSISKRTQMLEKITTQERDRTISFGDLLTMEPVSTNNGVFLSNTTPVKILTQERIDELQEAVTTLRRRSHGITDEIADINRSILSIELSEEVAAISGLTKD
jgi:signal-transduction protein with cAMP-binding, CBS, and nucleotidyltransferase domain